MNYERCDFRYDDGGRCSSSPFEHVHQPPPCANGKPERHHDYIPEPPHRHRFDRCSCGVTRAKVPA